MKKLNFERIKTQLTFKATPKIKALTADQRNVLTKVTENSNINFRFVIKRHVGGKCSGEDYVYDLNNKERLTLRAGVNKLLKGITSEILNSFTDKEIVVLEDVIIGVNI